MRMDDGGTDLACPDVLDRRAAEHRKPPGVVGVVARGIPVQAAPVEQVGGIHQGEQDAVGQPPLQHRNGDIAPSEAEREGHGGRSLGIDAAVAREHERDFMTAGRERLRQRGSNLRQAAGRGEGVRLGRHHHYRKNVAGSLDAPIGSRLHDAGNRWGRL